MRAFFRLAALSAAFAFLGFTGAAHAQDFPSRTVKIVVAFLLAARRTSLRASLSQTRSTSGQ